MPTNRLAGPFWLPEDEGRLVLLAQTLEGLRLGTRSLEEMRHLIGRVLGAEAAVESANLAAQMSSSTVVVMLAVADYFRYTRYHSLLTHTEPLERFVAEDIAGRIGDAAAEDFRWPLLFFAKLLPVDVADGTTLEEVARALDELAAAELVAAAEVEEGDLSPVVSTLTEAGRLVVDALCHDVSKVGLRLSSVDPNGEMGHESMLLVRGSGQLWLFDLTGDSGLVASLTSDALDELLENVFAGSDGGVPAPDNAAVPEAGSREVPKAEAVCPSCGATLAAGSSFCGSCGKPVSLPAATPAVARASGSCPKCGATLRPGVRFCGSCGSAV